MQRLMNLLKKYLSFVCLIGVTLVPLTAQPAHADIVTVLFTGFLSPVAGSGMEALNFELSDRFESSELQLDYSGQAFQYTQREDALDYISGIDNIDYLILIGHSFGGSSAIQLAENFLAPNGINVDLTFQIDSVDNPYGAPSDNALPDNVNAGYNYYQISTGFFEPQGETFVEGATNINTEVFFNDTTITHTNIDDDIRLHNQIYNDMRLVVVPEPNSMALMGTIFFSIGYTIRRPARRAQTPATKI